ncbi:hypothetical protein H0H81_011516 [Sphagnurus paluster]|uniref:Uncharacterized protein n=1 Tax=Sphagnurus paluster TaxID=117069 RepID=A0A9P7K3P7_9AGAR|nr:hypothetical protein H0H81_011516 [Sphagnurus paluster]
MKRESAFQNLFRPSSSLLRFASPAFRHFAVPEHLPATLDPAKHWPSLVVQRAADLTVTAGRYGERTNLACYYLVSPAIPQIPDMKIQAVRFTLESCDQGWCGDPGSEERAPGTYNACNSWFEAGIIRDADADAEAHISGKNADPRGRDAAVFDDDAFTRAPAREVRNPFEAGSRRWHLQYNVHACSTRQTHAVLWTKEDVLDDVQARARGAGTGRGFVGMLAPGDRVAIVVRAQASLA